MQPVLSLDGVSLSPSGPTLTVLIEARHALAIVGRSGSGKSRLLQVMAGLEKPKRGQAQIQGSAEVCAAGTLPRRATPELLAKGPAAQGGAARAAEALSALGLWEVRARSIAELSPGLLAGAEMAAALASKAQLILIDGQLDRLDPWTLRSTLSLLEKRVAAGAALCLVTNRAELASRTDTLVVLRSQRIAYAGSFSDLASSGPQTQVEVETQNRPGVRALVKPFEVDITETMGGLCFRAREGQALVAKLLLEGYGDVRSMLVRKPTFDELLDSIG